jgi:hypothetical protein
MRLQLLSVVAFAACVVGCNKSPEGGTSPAPAGSSGASPSKQAYFKVWLPANELAKDVKQGDAHTYEAKIDRENGFQQDVKLSVNSPDKITVKLDRDTVKGSEDPNFKITVSPAKEAALGKHMIKVTGTPATGNAVSADFEVKVIENK